MRRRVLSQISGESGSGKTEATKLALQFLVNIQRMRNAYPNRKVKPPWEGAVYQADKKHKRRSLGTPDNPLTKFGVTGIAARLLDINPILEAFGNAQTLKNDNSSRFGKWVQVDILPDGSVGGGSVRRYLLEKSRVIHQAENERNYHVFYYMIQGVEHHERQDLMLLEEHQYRYIRPTAREDQTDSASWDMLLRCMRSIGMQEEDIWRVFELAAAILRLGNVQFAEGDATRVVESEEHLVVTAKLLRVDKRQLELALTSRELVIAGESQVLPLRSAEAEVNRDSLAKELYSRLFDYVVGQINTGLQQTPPDGRRCVIDPDEAMYIGFLDIFGFEDLAENSFEQLCINYANERCHQLFLRYLFEHERQLCEEEGVRADMIIFHDNAPILQLIDANVSGIFAVVNDVCQVPRTTDETIITKLNGIHMNKHPAFGKPHGSSVRDCFVIKHSPADVKYQVRNFLSKNRDKLTPTTVECLKGSSNPLLRSMFDQDAPKERRATTFLSQKFLADMNGLMDLLQSTHIHFVRCIKSNQRQAPMTVDLPLVQNQFRYLGISDVCRLRQTGYYFRDTFAACYLKYSVSAFRPRSTSNSPDYRVLLRQQFETLLQLHGQQTGRIDEVSLTRWEEEGQVQFGKTRCFIRLRLFEVSQRMFATYSGTVFQHACTIQALVRGVQARRRVRVQRNASSVICNFVAAKVQYLRFRRIRRHAITIQAKWRQHSASQRYRTLQRKVVQLQRWWRFRLLEVHMRLFSSALASFQRKSRAYVLRLQFIDQAQRLAVVRHRLRRKIRNRKLHRAKLIVARSVARVLAYRKWRAEHVEQARALEAFRYERRVAHVRRAVAPMLRMLIAQRRYRRTKARIVQLQAVMRRWIHQLAYQRFRWAVVALQARMRGRTVRWWGFKGKVLATVLWAWWLKYLHVRRYHQLRFSAIKLQRWLRAWRDARTLQRRVRALAFLRGYFRRAIRRHNLRRWLPVVVTEGRAMKRLQAEIGRLRQSMKSQSPQIGMFDVDVLSAHQEQSIMLTDAIISVANELEPREKVVDVQITPDQVLMLTSEGDLIYSDWAATTHQLTWTRFQLPDIQSPAHTVALVKVVCGEKHILAVSEYGHVYTWGDGASGQLGHGQLGDSYANPRLVQWLAANNVVVTSAVAGDAHSAVLTETGLVYSWGSSAALGLGVGVERQLLPQLVDVLEPVRVQSIHSGPDFCLALTQAHELFGWGSNKFGQVTSTAKDTVSRLLTPRLMVGVMRAAASEASPIVAVSCGMHHVIAITASGALFTWGSNACGQLGVQKRKQYSGASPAHPLQKPVKFGVCGARQTFVVSTDGRLHAFGRLCCSFDNKSVLRDVDFPYTIPPASIPVPLGGATGRNHTPPATLSATWCRTTSVIFVSNARAAPKPIIPVAARHVRRARDYPELQAALGVSEAELEVRVSLLCQLAIRAFQADRAS